MSWDLGVPNLGGGYLYDALSKAGDNFDKLAGSVGGLLQRQKVANDTLDVLSKSGALPQEVYQSVLGKGIGAKEQMIGMYGGALNSKLKSQGEAAGQYAAMRQAGVPMFNPSMINQFPAGPNGQTPNQQPLPGTPSPKVVQPQGTDNSGVVPPAPAPDKGPATFTGAAKGPDGKLYKAPIVNGAPDWSKAVIAE